MDMMDSEPHAGMCEGGGEGLPRALRSSSKFSLLFIFQVPAKLGMSAEAESKKLLKEPVPRCDAWRPLSLLPGSLSLSRSLTPSSFSPCAPVSSALHSHCYTQVFFWASFLFFSLFVSFLPFFSHSCLLCVPQRAGSNLVLSSFIAAVLNGSQRRSLPLWKRCPINTGEQELSGLLSLLNSFVWKLFIVLWCTNSAIMSSLSIKCRCCWIAVDAFRQRGCKKQASQVKDFILKSNQCVLPDLAVWRCAKLMTHLVWRYSTFLEFLSCLCFLLLTE